MAAGLAAVAPAVLISGRATGSSLAPLVPAVAAAALRVLKLMLERLGADFGNQRVGHALAALNQAACQPALRAMRPSALAAAVLLASRKATGATPFWPSTLAGLTGCMDAEGSQLSADCDQVVAALADATLPAMA
jgi:pentatricopeptide repeat domain-containing protein 1